MIEQGVNIDGFSVNGFIGDMKRMNIKDLRFACI